MKGDHEVVEGAVAGEVPVLVSSTGAKEPCSLLPAEASIKGQVVGWAPEDRAAVEVLVDEFNLAVGFVCPEEQCCMVKPLPNQVVNLVAC